LIEDETHRPMALKLIQTLRELGVRVDYSLVPLKPNKQFKQASDARVQFTLGLQCDEEPGCVTGVRIKRLADRSEEVVAYDQVGERVKKHLDECPSDTKRTSN